MNIVFNKQLNLLLNDYGTVVNMAKKVGISRQTLGFYLSGKRMPDIESLVKIANATHHSLDWLVFGKNDSKQLNLYKERALSCLLPAPMYINAIVNALNNITTFDDDFVEDTI